MVTRSWDQWSGLSGGSLPEGMEKVLPSENVILLGWSLGAFLLFPFLNHSFVKGAVFISLAERFIKSEETPRAVNGEQLEGMKKDLENKERETITTFRTNCFSPMDEKLFPQEVETGFEKTALIHGLETLGQVDLRNWPVPAGKKVILIQGKKDRILPVFGARKMAERRGLEYIEVEDGGHALPFTHADLLAGSLQKLLG